MEDGKRPAIKKHLTTLEAVLLFVAMSLTATGVSLAYSGPHRELAAISSSGSKVGNSSAQNIRSVTAPTGSCPVPSFGPPTNYPAGEGAFSVTSADFNNDGNLDLVTTNNGPGTVSLLLGNGIGGFGSPSPFPVGNAPSDVATADFNHDGNADLAVARATGSPQNVSVLMGNGMGGFGPPTFMVAGTFPARLRVGDFNEDGHPDIVVSNQTSADVSVFLGDGIGGFSLPTNFPAGPRPLDLAVGDFNEDANLDLVVSNEVTPGTISVLLGNGMGAFGPPTSYPSGQDTGALEIGDFNEDGHLDVAARSGYGIAVLLGNGSGGFGSPTEYPTGGLTFSIVARDFTFDGHLDLASANNIPPGLSVTVMAGNGAGGFAPPVVFPAGFLSSHVEAGDFNEDGALDLAVTNPGDNTVSVLLNNCQPAATVTPTAVSTETPTSTSVPPTATSTSVPPTSTSTPVLSTATQTSTPPVSTPIPCTTTFIDVPPGHTFYESVRCLACRGIISGYADGTFRPNSPVTRGQLAKMVSNSAGFTEDPNPQIFADVPPTHTFYEWINRLTRRGHMTGYECGGPGEPCINNMPYFRPFANATRGQTSKIVSNAAGFTEPPVGQTFEDVPPTHTFYAEIQRLASRNVMQGYPCGGPFEPCVEPENRPYFRPGNDVTRGQSAKIAANAFFPGCQTP